MKGSRSILVGTLALSLAGCGGSSDVTPPPVAPAPPGPEAAAPPAHPTTTTKDDARIEELKTIAEDAYIYAFPLVLMDTTARFTTAVPKVQEDRAPMNQVARAQKFPEPDNRQVVSMNLDTLYAQAFIDVAKEPIVMTAPPAGKRYYLLPLLDAWTNVIASPGSRTTGNGKGSFAIVGPTWQGKLPPGVKEIRATTNLVWLLGRTQTNGKADYPNVIAFEKGITLTPLSVYGKPAPAKADVPVDPSIDTKIPPVLQAMRMEPRAFFTRAAELMTANPPYAADAPALKRFETLGFAPGKPFDPMSVDPRAAAAIQGVSERAIARIKKAGNEIVSAKNGWRLYLGTGEFGTDYAKRAVVALFGLGANLNADAIYPRTETDAEGKPLVGDKAYVLHFDKGELPAVKAFWSVTMYDSDQFLVPNPINRYAIGDRDKLVYGKDGSLDLYVQNASPGKEREANWLPAPKGSFNLIMRLYWPKPEALEAKYVPPPVKVAK